jgi:hypothetical protein
MQKSKEEIEKEYLEVKFLLSQLGDEVPHDIREQVNLNLKIAHRGLYVILPACDDLIATFEELIFTKYPEFKDNSVPGLRKLVSQVSDDLADTVVKNVNGLLVDLENDNTPYIENEEQFQNLVLFFATPLDESEDQSPEVMAKTESSRTINNEKKEFLNEILKVLFRYFEEQLNNLDAKGWQLIGIALGHIFLRYMKRCYVLMAGLVEGILTENPEMNYEDLEKKLLQDVAVSPENAWLLNL